MSKYPELVEMLKEELKDQLVIDGIDQAVEMAIKSKMKIIIEALMPSIQEYVVNSLNLEYAEYKQGYVALSKYGALTPVNDTIALRARDFVTGHFKVLHTSLVPNYMASIDSAVFNLQSQIDELKNQLLAATSNPTPLNPPQT